MKRSPFDGLVEGRDDRGKTRLERAVRLRADHASALRGRARHLPRARETGMRAGEAGARRRAAYPSRPAHSAPPTGTAGDIDGSTFKFRQDLRHSLGEVEKCRLNAIVKFVGC